MKNFAEQCRVLEECLNPAQQNPEALENSDDFSSIGEFPREIGACKDFDDPVNLTENLIQDSEGANPTNSDLLNAGTSLRGRQ